MKRKVIILLGPPGSGKGTQAVQLSKKLGVPHVSTGDLFRENLSKNTELGKRANAFIEKGLLVPDAVVLDMLFDRVSKPDCIHGYLLDGFPRTIPQAEALDGKLNGTQAIAINLNVPDDVIIKRIGGRLTCSKCGHIHNLFYSPPKEKNKCDKCGSNLIQRKDDGPDVVTERLRVYHTQTEPLVDFYAKKGILTHIDGQQNPEVVFAQLLKIVA